ncbi:histidine kinase dimerization/phosphoacceptor domain -containing protein [Methanocella sp. MCL-LM]|uniref:PAS domain-containing sensor histidine kinase n=1 Tax=Methanocella sp. MCL-LM TaxID=3412035 RepID=UPI003C710EB9
MGLKKPDESPYLMVGIEFIIAIAVSLFFISMAMNNFQALPAQAAILILMLLCLPLLIIIYWTAGDSKLKPVVMGLIIFFVVQTISGIFWYVLPQVEAASFVYGLPAVMDIAMFLMPLAYIPLLYVLTVAVLSKKSSPSLLLYGIVGSSMGAITSVLVYLGLYAYGHPGSLFDVLIFGYAMIGDVLVTGLCAVLLLANLRKVSSYLYGIVLVSFFLSFVGDTLGALTGLGIADVSNYTQIVYSIMMAFVTVALLLYSMGSVNRVLVDRLNRELYDTRRLVDDLLRHTPDAMCVAAVDGKVIRANGQFCRLLGRSPDEIVGSFNIFHDCDRLGSGLCGPATQLQEGISTTVHRVCSGSDGRLFRVKMFPTYSATGQMSSYMIILEDVTELEQATDDLKRAHDELETRVEQRTTELAEANTALSGEIEERKLAEDMLRTSLAEKDVLLKEVHHRVKNNLQIVTSLLNLQVADIKDPHDVHIFRESQNRIRSIALVHEYVYQSDDLSRVDFGRYAEALTRQLYQSFQGQVCQVRLTVDVPGIRLGVDKAIPCGLIINELLTGLLSYHAASGQGGEVCLGLHEAGDGKLVLALADRQISDGPDSDIAARPGEIVEVLVGQLEGTITVDRTNGISYTITFDA